MTCVKKKKKVDSFKSTHIIRIMSCKCIYFQNGLFQLKKVLTTSRNN